MQQDDQRIDLLYDSASRIGRMGKDIHEELKLHDRCVIAILLPHKGMKKIEGSALGWFGGLVGTGGCVGCFECWYRCVYGLVCGGVGRVGGGSVCVCVHVCVCVCVCVGGGGLDTRLRVCRCTDLLSCSHATHMHFHTNHALAHAHTKPSQCHNLCNFHCPLPIPHC